MERVPRNDRRAEVAKAVRYPGMQWGRATVAEQYGTAMRNFEQNVTFLKALPLSEKERAFAILTWASPVVYPMVEIRQKVDSLARESMDLAYASEGARYRGGGGGSKIGKW